MIRRFALAIILLAALFCACLTTWLISWRHGIEALRQQASARVERIDANLKSTLDRYTFLPYLLSNHPYIQETLGAAPSATTIQRANTFLARVNQEASANATYVINAAGVCIAASNWQGSVSFVGRQYLFRPYFTDALKGGVGRFFGIGTSAAEPGYFVSQPVKDRDGTIIGVAVVKLDLEWVERTDASEPLAVSDNNGVIFLSSEPSWKYHTLSTLPAAVEQEIERSQQYADHRLLPLPILVEETLGSDARIVRIMRSVNTDVGGRSLGAPGTGHVPASADSLSLPPSSKFSRLAPSSRYLAITRQLVEPHWQLTTFTSLAPVISAANYATAITAFSGVCIFLMGFYLRMRRARIRDMIRSGALLRTAYAELNQRVEERTADLSAANTRLQTEVGERTRAEQELRTAHRELVQASKLAALGQMAAGITHELNQPLAALRTFSDNTRILLERGDVQSASENLQAIASLTDRMGRITNQLKLFIGKARPRDAITPVPRAIANALTLLDSRLRGIEVGVWFDPVCGLDDTPNMQSTHDNDAGATSASARSVEFSGTLAASIARTGQQRLAINLADSADTPDTPAVWCDQLRLEQLLINVIGNAADALRGVSEPAIEVMVSVTPSTVTVAIVDNGPGIAEEIVGQLFEPFFTTKENGEGMGLGLAISAAIANEYGGTLRATNRPTHGAVFILTLRRADNAVRETLLASM